MTDSKLLKNTGKRLPPNAGRGRKKGVPNRITKTVKEAIETAFEGVGGEEYLMEQARANPQGFMALLGKLLPSGASVNVGVQINQDGRESFESILSKVITIEGGLPDSEKEKARQIGELWQKYQRGEPLPDQLVIGGLPDPFEEAPGAPQVVLHGQD